MRPEDRLALNQLNTSSSGQHSGSRKRQRDEDNPHEATRRTHRASGPWGGAGQADLHSDRRQPDEKPSSTSFPGDLIIQSQGEQGICRGSLAHTPLARPSLECTLPGLMDHNATATSVQSSHRSSPAQPPPFSRLSPEIDNEMLGSISLAQALGAAETAIAPEPSKLHDSERAISRGRSRSSPEPIHLLSSPTAKPSSHATTAPIPVEDDDSDDIVEKVTPARSRLALTTPENQTPLRAGYVGEVRARPDPPTPQGQPILEGYLGQTRSSQPEPPRLHVSERAISPGSSRSSFDPIDLISPTAKPSSHATVAPIPMKDDDSGETVEVEEVTPARSRPPPTTPKKQAPLHAGHVRQTGAKFDPPKSQGQSTLEGYLEQTRPSQPGSSSRTTAAKIGLIKGKQITPGLTRLSARPPPALLEFELRPQIPQARQQARASNRMGTKTKDTARSARQSGLVVTTVGDRTQRPLIQASARSRGHDHNQQRIALNLPVRDWYCGSRHHTSGHNGKDPYTLTFTGNNLTLFRRGEALHVLQSDLVGFEVAESGAGKASEFIPVVLFLFETKFISSAQWKDYSGDDDDPKLLVYFDAQSENFTACWQELISRMARWIPKQIMTIDNMKDMIQCMANRAPSAKTTKQPAGPTLVTPDDEPHNSKPLAIHNPDEVVLRYPQSETGAVPINRGELARLAPGELFNDSLIELGLKIWLNDLRERDPTSVDHIHVFNHFFLKKLDPGQDKGCQYNKVKKWTAKFDLFSKKFIIIPIREGFHWYLAIICFPEHTLKSPTPHVSARPASVTRYSDAAAAVKAAERQISLERGVEAGTPTEPGRMEVNNVLDDQSRKAIVSATPPEISSDAMRIDALDDHPSEPAILDMTNGNGEGKDTSQPIEEETSYVEKFDHRYRMLTSAAVSTITGKKTWILILDSLGVRHPRTVRLLREYLQSEAQERRKAIVELKDAGTSGGFVEDKHLPAPVQPEWCDSGTYLLHYVEMFHLNPLKILALPNGAERKSHPQFPQYEELWQTSQVKHRREAFRDKAHALSSAWLESKRPTSNSDTSVAGPPKSHVAHGLSPLLNIKGDVSLQRIEAPVPDTGPSTPCSLGSKSLRTGILPPGRAESSEGEVEEGVEIPMLESPTADESNASRSTRRGKKSGTRHGSWHGSEGSLGSPKL